jgi:hypothetical protein
MHRIIMITTCVIFLLAVSVLPVTGEVLFSCNVGQGGSQPGTTSSITYPIGYNSLWPKMIFSGKSFTLDDIGRTMTITPATDPNFSAFTALFTDGSSEGITFWFSPAPAVSMSGQVWSESSVVWGSTNDPRIDLHGFKITSYSIKQNSLSITNSDDGRSSFSASITFSAEGYAVPEPSTFVLLGLGALGLMTIAWQRRQ